MELNLNPWFKPTSFNLVLVALAQITAYCHVMIMHHIVAYALIVFFSFAGVSPPSVDDVPII